MVKVGFIVEGSTESIIVNSSLFVAFLQNHGFELVTPVVDAKGGGNLLPKYVDSFVAELKGAGAEEHASLMVRLTSPLLQLKRLKPGFWQIPRQ